MFCIDEDSTHVVSMVDVWMGGVDQWTFGPCAAAPLLPNQTSSSSEKLSECLAGICQKKAMYKVNKTVSPGAQYEWN